MHRYVNIGTALLLREPVVLPEIPSQMIYINEIMTSNGSYVQDQAGDNPDWIGIIQSV